MQGNELQYLEECIQTGWVSSAGHFVDRFETAIAQYTGAPHAVACVNGTAALHTAMLVSGVGKGDEVLLPTLTFIAPVNAVRYVDAQPVFIDCDAHLNIDVEQVRRFCAEQCVFDGTELRNTQSGARVKAIVVVHVCGHPVDLEPILDMAKQWNLVVIEDASESLGSYYRAGRLAGRKTGAIGDIGCYSFNGNKIITAGGGGMLVTSNPEYAQRARYLTTQAKDDDTRFLHHEIGYNYRLTNVQAALGCAQLEQLEQFIALKRGNYQMYRECLDGIVGVSIIAEPHYGCSNHWLHTLVVDEAFGSDAESVRRALRAAGFAAQPLWELNHRQRPYRHCQRTPVDRAMAYHYNCLHVPSSANVQPTQIREITTCIKKCGMKNG